MNSARSIFIISFISPAVDQSIFFTHPNSSPHFLHHAEPQLLRASQDTRAIKNQTRIRKSLSRGPIHHSLYRRTTTAYHVRPVAHFLGTLLQRLWTHHRDQISPVLPHEIHRYSQNHRIPRYFAVESRMSAHYSQRAICRLTFGGILVDGSRASVKN